MLRIKKRGCVRVGTTLVQSIGEEVARITRESYKELKRGSKPKGALRLRSNLTIKCFDALMMPWSTSPATWC